MSAADISPLACGRRRPLLQGEFLILRIASEDSGGVPLTLPLPGSSEVTGAGERFKQVLVGR